MKIGTVVGRVWASKKIDEMPAGALLVVEINNNERVVALDPLGCGDGEQVLLAGDQAVNAINQAKPCAVDLIVVAVLDQ